MCESGTTLYTIPIDDKYIIYAPLLPLAFIGNKAMVDLVHQKVVDPGAEVLKSELIDALEKTGLFMPDKEAARM